jgi:thiamine pyrophosphate-dependent acetolactate synthase large subunit-like protein
VTLTTAQACQIIAAHRQPRDVAVTTMGAMYVWDAVSPGELNMCSVPMMGGASTLGLGIALTHPDRRVIILDGDGSLLMQLGSLVTIARHAPENLIHFVFDNGLWYSIGGYMPHPGSGTVDYRALAVAAGYRHAYEATTATELEHSLPQWLSEPGPTLARLAIAGDNYPAFSAANPQPFLPDAQFTRMGDQARAVRAALTAKT